MIDVHWVDEDGRTRRGDATLIDAWQQQSGFIWIDLCGEPADRERELLARMGCHRLAIQDAQRIRHPPKVEHFEANSFLIYRGIRRVQPDLEIETLSIAFFVGAGYLITRHDGDSVGVEQIKRDENLDALLRAPAQLLCRILKISANTYLDAILEVEEVLADLEEQMSAGGSDEVLMTVISYRTKLRKLRRVFAYHEKIFAEIMKQPATHMTSGGDETRHLLQDVYDKFERLSSLSSMYYDLCGDLSDGYLSLTSHQLNRTMQVLTVITTIFVPLGFLAGLYGMNFDNIPELHFKDGYFVLISAMAAIALGLLTLFRRKRWL